MSKQKQPAKQELKKWPKRPKQPVVFMFQPTEFEIVPPDKLSEWEKLMLNEVGFPPELVRAMSNSRMTGTTSYINGTPCDCDNIKETDW